MEGNSASGTAVPKRKAKVAAVHGILIALFPHFSLTQSLHIFKKLFPLPQSPFKLYSLYFFDPSTPLLPSLFPHKRSVWSLMTTYIYPDMFFSLFCLSTYVSLISPYNG
jgi:hypothetical protein